MIIRPLLRGRDIKRYSYDFADKYLIATFPSKNYNIDEFPAVKQFLLGFYPKLKQTGENLTEQEIAAVLNHAKTQGIPIKDSSLRKSRKKTTNRWFETQDSISYWEDFYKQKIVWKIIGSNINFLIEDKGLFYNNAANILTSESINLNNLIVFLNSKLFEWYFKKIVFIEVEGGGIQMFSTVMERVPILNKITNITELQIKKLLKTKNYEAIDKLVFELYNLNEEEISFIEAL